MPELTAEQLVDLQVPQDVRISPSGKHCVYVCKPIARAAEHFISSLWIAELGKEHSARQLTSGLSHDSSPRWCPDTTTGESIAFISDRAKPGESSAIYVLSMDGGEAYPVTKVGGKKAIEAFKWSPDGQCIAFLSADEKSKDQETREEETGGAIVYGEDWEFDRLRLLHVATREISTLVADDSHVTDFAWKDSKEIAYVSQKTPTIDSAGYHGAEFRKVSLALKESEVLGNSRFPGPAHDLAWSGNSLFFLAGTTPDSVTTSKCVYKMSASTGDWCKYYQGKASDSTCVGSLRSFARGTKQFVAAQVLDGLTDHIQILGPNLYNIADTDSSTTPKVEHEIQSWPATTWDFTYIPKDDRLANVIGYSTASEPSEIYSLEEGNRFCQLSNHGQAIAKLNNGEAEPMYCKAQDGTECDGFFVRPSNAPKGKPLPTVVLIHGGPYSRISETFNILYFYWGPMLLSAGYGILCPNYRGGSGHGESYAAQARGGMGTTDYSDVIALAKAGVASGLIDPEKVIIGGYSQGGFLSYLATTRPDFNFRGAICGGGVSDLDMLSMTSDTPWSETQLAGSAPWSSSADDTRSRHGSAIWHMKNVKTPILILHGEKDERVPLTQAVAFHRGCLHYGVPCEFVTYPREGHVFEERKHVVDMMKRIRRFVDLHLK